jgi:hypothetical protein
MYPVCPDCSLSVMTGTGSKYFQPNVQAAAHRERKFALFQYLRSEYGPEFEEDLSKSLAMGRRNRESTRETISAFLKKQNRVLKERIEKLVSEDASEHPYYGPRFLMKSLAKIEKKRMQNEAWWDKMEQGNQKNPMTERELKELQEERKLSAKLIDRQSVDQTITQLLNKEKRVRMLKETID